MGRVINKFGRLLLAACFLSILGCSRHVQIILVSNDGSHQLTYDGDKFIPQARTTADIQVLLDNAIKIMQQDPADAVTGASLRAAMFPPPDYKEMERVVYNYKVGQLNNRR